MSVERGEECTCGPMVHHGQYYFDDGSVEFLIDNTLYKVHGSIFARYSARFRAFVEESEDHLPTGWVAQRSPRGETVFVELSSGRIVFSRPGFHQTDDGKIILKNITQSELDAFLSVLYPHPGEDYMQDPRSADDYKHILKIATDWSFDSIRNLAIKKLQNSGLSVIELLYLSKAHSIESWYEDVLVDLCLREEPLSEEEIRYLEPNDIADITSIREGKHPVVGLDRSDKGLICEALGFVFRDPQCLPISRLSTSDNDDNSPTMRSEAHLPESNREWVSAGDCVSAESCEPAVNSDPSIHVPIRDVQSLPEDESSRALSTILSEGNFVHKPTPPDVSSDGRRIFANEEAEFEAKSEQREDRPPKRPQSNTLFLFRKMVKRPVVGELGMAT